MLHICGQLECKKGNTLTSKDRHCIYARLFRRVFKVKEPAPVVVYGVLALLLGLEYRILEGRGATVF